MKPPVKRSRGESGTALLVTIVAMVWLIIPVAGLAVDTGFLYATKARLQASVDAAALGAARALSVGSSTTAQTANAKQNAVNWFYANFPAGLGIQRARRWIRPIPTHTSTTIPPILTCSTWTSWPAPMETRCSCGVSGSPRSR